MGLEWKWRSLNTCCRKKKKENSLPAANDNGGKTRSLSIEFVTPGERIKRKIICGWRAEFLNRTIFQERSRLLKKMIFLFWPLFYFRQGSLKCGVVSWSRSNGDNWTEEDFTSEFWISESTKLGLIQRISRWLATEGESDYSLTLSERRIRAVIHCHP